jgi:hypothetical protein
MKRGFFHSFIHFLGFIIIFCGSETETTENDEEEEERIRQTGNRMDLAKRKI